MCLQDMRAKADALEYEDLTSVLADITLIGKNARAYSPTNFQVTNYVAELDDTAYLNFTKIESEPEVVSWVDAKFQRDSRRAYFADEEKRTKVEDQAVKKSE